MKNLSLYILLILLSANTSYFSQKTAIKDNFTEIVGSEEGDLNGDNRADKIIATTTNSDGIRPFRLQIFMSQPYRKNLKLIVSTTKLFENQYPFVKNGKQKNFRIPDFFIENGKLTILTDINELQSRYIFRFKDGNFELITISRVIQVGNETTTETEINLLTGSKVVYDQDFGPNKKYKFRKKTKPKPLPKIQDLTFSDLNTY